jgi:gliding motility-associated-like protein
MKYYHLLLFLVLFSWLPSANATHNRGGEITYKQIGTLSFEVTIITYTKLTSAADRPLLFIEWGDNTGDSVPRLSKIPIAGSDIGKNTYIWTHTYPGPANYIISLEDPNRNEGVVNIPNSVNVPFYIQTTISINPFFGNNSSPIMLNPPIDQGCVNKLFVHNPGAYDPDGDSLSYELVKCRGTQGLDIPGYTFPTASLSISLNSKTGDFIWANPIRQGEYNIAMLIKEWRNGVLLSAITRDMQIDISTCNNNPPVLRVPNDTCVLAGSTLSAMISARDPDNNQVTITSTSGLYSLAVSPAVFPASVTGFGSVSAMFRWSTVCSHIQKEPYTVYFKATDNGSIKLVDIRTWRIRVVAPEPKNVVSSSKAGTIRIQWNPSDCPNATGYKIYRKENPSGWNPANCETGVPAYTGFSLIDTVMGLSNTQYVDDNKGLGLASGVQYCYRITAFYSNGLVDPFNGPESYASAEVCEVVKRDLPTIIKTDVVKTDASNGSIQVMWANPTQLDTTQYPGPYAYVLYRSDSKTLGSRVQVARFNSIYLNNWTDTSFIDQGINTKDKSFTYQLEFLFNGGNTKVGPIKPSTSCFLSVIPESTRMLLKWENGFPWYIDSTVILRKINGVFTPIDTLRSNASSYVDENLDNGVEYCYQVKTIGSFPISANLPITFNRSQEICDLPKDTIPPCTLAFTLDTNCVNVEVTLNWTVTTDTCNEDIQLFRIYYKPVGADVFKKIDSVGRDIRTYTYQAKNSIAGCYFVAAVDSSGNESQMLDSLCADNCPDYTLPNIFSPNKDGKNDLFVPFPYRGVSSIDLHIYNRWGIEVFSTTNPDINWDGTSTQTGQSCGAGVYFYQCKVNYLRLKEPSDPIIIKGIIQIVEPK